MPPAVVVPVVDAPLLISPAMRAELLPHVARLLEYLMHSHRPLAGRIAADLVACATIVGRVSGAILALVPIA